MNQGSKTASDTRTTLEGRAIAAPRYQGASTYGPPWTSHSLQARQRRVRKFCLLGATNDDRAGCFEVARCTIDDWIASVPECAARVREGRAAAGGRVARGHYDHAIGDHMLQRAR